MKQWTSRSERETRAIGGELVEALGPQALLLITGDLGVGKTVLAQGIADRLGIDAHQVQSPSFVLVQEFRGDGGQLVHLDLYRLNSEESEALGIDEILVGEGFKVVEWAERLPWVPEGAARCRIERSEAGRSITLFD